MVYLFYGIHISVDLAQYEIFRAKVCYIWQGLYKREGRHKASNLIFQNEVCILSIEILDSNMPILLFLTRLLI